MAKQLSMDRGLKYKNIITFTDCIAVSQKQSIIFIG